MKYFPLSKPNQIQFIYGTAYIFVDWRFLIKVDPSSINHATEEFYSCEKFYKRNLQK